MKKFLWKLGLLNESKCPYCKKELIKRGFEGHNERFECNTEGCRFNE